MKILIVLITIFCSWDLFDMLADKKNSKYVRIRNSIFDIIQLVLIGSKLSNYSNLTWLETFIPSYILFGIIIGESYFYFKIKKIIKKDKNRDDN